MKFSAAQLKRFVEGPDPAVRAVLIYGGDEGLVRERAAAVAAAIVEDVTDPFNVADLDADMLREDPARLADEAAAISMMGGRRLVKVTGAGDRLGKLFAEFLADPPGDGPEASFVLVTAGDLAAKGSLRKAFEGTKLAAAVPCYADTGETLDSLIDQVLGGAGLSVNDDARAYLRDHLGGDRVISRTELEKLALYKMGDDTPVSLEDARNNVGDSAADLFDAVGAAAARGDLPALSKALTKAQATGESPIGMLRLMTRRMQRMHLVARLMATGTPADSAFKALKPPAFSREASEMRMLLNRWSAPRLATALDILLDAETQCKTTGLPAEAICARTMMRLALAARAGG